MPFDVPIILHHTVTDTNTPALLYAGEMAIAVGPTKTRAWIGDGAANRLLLSTDRTDNPLFAPPPDLSIYLPLAGGRMIGSLEFGNTGFNISASGDAWLDTLALANDAEADDEAVTLRQLRAATAGGGGGSTEGVTDGSDAAAGEIGEYLYAEVTSGTVANNVSSQPVSLSLSAGDWDVSCLAHIVFTLSTPASVYQTIPALMTLGITGVSLVGLIAPAMTGFNAGTGQYGSLSFGTLFGPVRLNVDQAVSAGVVVDPAISATTQPGAISRVAIWARRAR